MIGALAAAYFGATSAITAIVTVISLASTALTVIQSGIAVISGLNTGDITEAIKSGFQGALALSGFSTTLDGAGAFTDVAGGAGADLGGVTSDLDLSGDVGQGVGLEDISPSTFDTIATEGLRGIDVGGADVQGVGLADAIPTPVAPADELFGPPDPTLGSGLYDAGMGFKEAITGAISGETDKTTGIFDALASKKGLAYLALYLDSRQQKKEREEIRDYDRGISERDYANLQYIVPHPSLQLK